MRSTSLQRSVALIVGALSTVVLAAATSAYAADDAAVEKVSFLQILIHGAQWPGIFIALMSLASVTIIIEHFWTIRRITMFPESELEATRRFIEDRKFKECVEFVRNGRSMFADVLTASLRHGRHGFDAMRAAAEERAGAWGSRLFRRVEYLNIIGNLSPLLGLLGTVLGMIEAFSAMQEAHGAYKPENLAGGISLALVNTFLGLAVAIVSLGFFGLCRNRVDAMTVAAQAAVLDLLEYFRPGAVVPNATNAVPANAKSEARKPSQPAEPPK
jgi:biopolymer transport protein ExbB